MLNSSNIIEQKTKCTHLHIFHKQIASVQTVSELMIQRAVLHHSR